MFEASHGLVMDHLRYHKFNMKQTISYFSVPVEKCVMLSGYKTQILDNLG